MAIGGFFPGIFSGIDSTFIFWGIAFLILLGVTNFVFTRFFKKQKIIGTMVAFLVSIAIVYYSSLKYPSFLDNVFYGVGIDPSQILSILPWIGIAAAILIVILWGFGMLLMAVGLILIITGLTDLAYDPMVPIMIGIIVFIIGLWLWWRKKKRKKRGPRPPKERRPPKEPSEKKKKSKVRLLIEISGKGKTNPGQGMYTIRKDKKIKISIKKGKIKYWSINGANYGKREFIKLKMDRDYKVIAVFKGQEEEEKQEKRILIIKVQGSGKTIPAAGRYESKKDGIMRIKARPKDKFKNWNINGVSKSRHASLTVKMDKNYEVLAIFERGNGPDKPKEPDKPKDPEDKKDAREDNRLNLARKLGIKKLQKEYNLLAKEYKKGLNTAEEYHKKATRLGWTSSRRIGPRQGESEKDFKIRAKQANEVYKAWYRQYNRNIQMQKQAKEIKERVEHLQKQIK